VLNGGFPDSFAFCVRSMWNKERISLNSCTECGGRVPTQAEACADCGYPVTTRAYQETPHGGEPHSIHREYRLIQTLGASVAIAGLIAAMNGALIAAAVSLAVGIAVFLTGLLGSWWNRDD
jgi:ribosomal protein L40E